MKKIYKWLLLLLVAVFAVLFALGMVFKNSVLLYTAIGILFGGSFLVCLASVIFMFVQAKKRADELDEESENKRLPKTAPPLRKMKAKRTGRTVRQTALKNSALTISTKRAWKKRRRRLRISYKGAAVPREK